MLVFLRISLEIFVVVLSLSFSLSISLKSIFFSFFLLASVPRTKRAQIILFFFSMEISQPFLEGRFSDQELIHIFYIEIKNHELNSRLLLIYLEKDNASLQYCVVRKDSGVARSKCRGGHCYMQR